MSAAFTPGPWFAKDAYRGQGFCILREERGQGWVRDRRLDTPAGEFNEADARLIAAAPELYEALDQILGCFGSDIKAYDNDLYHLAYEVAAKVRGDTL